MVNVQFEKLHKDALSYQDHYNNLNKAEYKTFKKAKKALKKSAGDIVKVSGVNPESLVKAVSQIKFTNKGLESFCEKSAKKIFEMIAEDGLTGLKEAPSTLTSEFIETVKGFEKLYQDMKNAQIYDNYVPVRKEFKKSYLVVKNAEKLGDFFKSLPKEHGLEGKTLERFWTWKGK